MWPVYALMSAFLESTKDVIGKSVSNKTNEYVAAFSLQLFGALILTPFLLYQGIPFIQPKFWFVMVGFCFTIPSAAILYMRAVKLSPLSLSVPMLAFNPVFTAFNAVLFDRKYPTYLGWTGIILVCTGLYIFRLDKSVLKKGFFYPFMLLRDEPGALAMLGVSLIWSIGAHLSKASVSYSSPLFAGWAGTVIGSVTLFNIARRKIFENFHSITRNIRMLVILGIVDGLSILSMYTALSFGLTASVISIKRTNILWSSLYGSIVLKEQFGRLKMIGLFCMFVGVLLLLFL